MSDWWEEYKKKNNVEQKVKQEKEEKAAKQQQMQSYLDVAVPYYERYKAAKDTLSKQQKTDKRSQVMMQGFHNNPVTQAASELEFRQKNLERDVPLYQQMAEVGMFSSRLGKKAQQAASDAYGGYTDAVKRYQDTRNSYLNNLKKNDLSGYYAQTKTREQIESELSSMSDDTHERKGLTFGGRGGKIDDSDVDISPEVRRASLESALNLYKQEDFQRTKQQYAPNGQLSTAFASKRDEGARKYEADKAASSASVRQQVAAKAAEDYAAGKRVGGMTREDIRRAEEESGYYHEFEEALHLTDADRDIFYALYADDPEKAKEFLHQAKLESDEAYLNQFVAESVGDEAPMGGNWLDRGAAFFGGTGLRMIGGAYHLIDPYNEQALDLVRTGNALVAGGGQRLQEKGLFDTGALAGELHIDEELMEKLHLNPYLNGKGIGDLYQLGSSMLESGVMAATAAAAGDYYGALGKIINFLGTAIMGSSAAASDYDESIKRGLNRRQAIAHATMAGMAEAGFEYISLDQLVNQDITRGFVKNFFMQGGIEMSEELCTSLANRVTDAMLARADGYDTQIEYRMKELMALGVSKNEAEKKAETEWLADLFYDGLGGFISGGFMTAGNTISNWSQYQAARNQQLQTGQMAREYGETAALQRYAEENDIGWYGDANTAEPVKLDENAGLKDKLQNKIDTRRRMQQDRQIGSDTQRVQAHIQEQFAGKSIQEQTQLRDQMIKQYGTGIAPAVYEAISVEAAKKAASLKSADEIRAARDQAVNETQDRAMKRAIADGYDQAVFGQAMRSGNADEAGRYFQQLRNTGEGGMTLEATVKDQDGQSRQIAITGMTEDGKGVKLADGTTVAVSKLRADADTMDAVQRIAELEMGADADSVLQAYIKADKQGADGYRWLMDYSLAYEQGRTNKISLEEAVKRSSLDRQTVMDAYTLGQREAHQSTRDAVEALKAMPKKKGITGKTSNIDTSEIEGVTLNESEREQFEFANKVFSLIGVDVKWVASAVKNGRFVGANGSYLNGVVTLDVHAGRNFLQDVNSGILATTGHELTHFLQQYAPEQYQALKEFLFRQIVQGSANGEVLLERMIWDKQRRASSKLSRRAAEDEVVADACQTMLRDSKVIREFAQQDEEAAKGVARWLDKWFGKLKQAFSRSAQLTEEARFVDSFAKEVREAFGKLWDEALREAVDTHDRVGNIEKPQQQQNSDRDTEYLEAVEKKEDWKVEKMVRDAAVQWGAATDERGKPIPLYHGTPRFGFTVFKDPAHEVPFIYTSTNPTVSAHYAGDKNYAGRRPIGRKYRTGTKTEDIIENAKWVYESNYHVMSTEEKLKAYKEIEKQAIEIADKLDEVHIGAWNAESEAFKNMPDEVANAISWVEDMFWTIRDSDYKFNFDGKEDYPGERAEFFKVLDSDIENAKTQRAIVQEFYDENRKNLSKQEKAFLSYLLSYEVGDAAIDIEYKLLRVATENDVIMNEAGNINNPLDLKKSMDMYHEIGAYTLYGNLGDNPFIFDANGAQFWGVKVPEMGDGYYSTDSISKWAYENGYTGVVMKNIYDYGDKADNYVFFNSSQLKSADPVTYDDAGNVIPLSERFNRENEDIRYSERDELASDNQVHDITNRSGETVGVQDGNGHVQFSQRTWRESGKEKMQEYLDERVRKYEANRNDPEGMHPDDAKALMDAVQEQYDALDEIVRQQPGNYKTYEEWADAEVETDIFGNPVFSWLKANGDYGISGDASLICVKRRTLDAVFDYMIQNNMIQDGPEGLKLAQESIVAINDIIRAHGFETACSTCYIDARRYRAAIVAGSFCNVYNKLVRSMLKGKTGVPINAFNFGGNKSVTPLANSLDTLSDSEINWDGINKAIRDQEAKWESKGWEKFTEDGEEKWRRNGTVKNLPTSGTTEYRIALALKEKPSLRKLALRSDFLSGNGFLELNRTNKDILTLYNVKKGQAGPKATETDIQYLHEALENSFITPDRMFKAGGFRLQSFSDYVPRLVFDYVEIIGDLAAKGVPAHMYTKEILCVLQHGLTGTKINMSLIPAMVKKGIAPGLDADGNYLWRDGQTFGSTAYSLSPKLEAHLSKILGYQVKGRLTGAQGFELAKLIQNDPAYGKNNGTIAIGVSEAQIRKMLDDADIRMVIPYHKSGLNHILASMMEIPGFENYESYQNTLKWNGTKWSKVDVDFDFNEAVQKHKGDARAAAQDYLDWCEENDYKPKFSGVASGSARNSYNKAYDFTQHADWQTGTMTGEAESNYYKVLADFTCYDAEGKVSRQEAVKLNYPGTDSAFGSMKQLIEMGLESDAMLQAKQDAEVPKIVDDIRREIPKFEAAGRNMKAYAQLKENVEGRQYSERDYDNTISDYDLIMEASDEGLVGDQKAQLRETKQRITRVQSLRNKLADTRQELKAAEKKIAELEKPGSGKFAQQMRAARAEARLGIERAQARDRQAAAVKREHAKLIETQRALRATETKLANQIKREQDIIERKLTPPAMQKLLTKERQAAEEKVKQHKDEVFANYKERQQQAKLRGRIKNLSDEMKRRMTNPSERAYVPASLYGSMTKLADVLDGVLAPGTGTKAEAKYRSMMDAIHGLAREYSAVKDLDDPTYSSEYDEEIQEAISEIERVLERKDASWLDELTGDTKKGLRELSTGELQRIYELMRSINYSMVGATAMLGHSGFKNVFDAMRSVVDQQNGMESLNSLGKVKRWNRQRLLDNLSVMRAVEMMSGWERDAALYQLMHNIEQGTDESWSWVMDYNKSLQDLKTGKNEKEYRDALTKKLDFGVTDEEGRKVLMTKMQALQILMTAEREAHNDKLLHLQTGGAVIRDAIDLQNGKGAKSRSQTVKVTPELIRDIQNGLTDWDRAYMKAIRSYFRKEGRRTNEILYKLKHKVLQTEDYYVPYNVDANYLETRLDENQAMNMWVKMPGSTNALKQKAKQPVIIDGMDTVMARHVKEIADYIGLAIPIRDFSKVYNGRLATGEDNPLPVKKTIDRTFGAKGQHLLTQAVIDVQGGSQHQNWSSGISDFLSWLQGAFVKSALLINPSVTIKQAASYIAAESVLSHRALVAGNRALFSSDEAKSPALIAYLFANPEGKTAKRIYNEIDKYTSLHYQRRQGMSQAEIAEQANRNGPMKRWMNGIGASMEQNALGHAVRKAGENLNPVTWIQRMDVATTATLWVACKEQAKLDGMKAGTDEYWNHVTELYERCLRETQPMYDGLHRTAHQKQAGGLVQFLFPFRTVPIQNHGQLAASYEALKASKGKSKARQAAAKKFFAKTVWAQTESAVVFSVMTFLAALLKRKTKKYRDEDEEFTAESFAKGLMTDVGSTLFSVLQPMYGSELVSLVSRARDKFDGSSGYTYDAFSVGVVDMINDLASSGDKLFADTGKLMRGEDVSFEDFRDHVLAMLTKGAKLAGIPADTVKTYAQGMLGNIEDIRAGRIPAINDESWDRATAVNANRFYKAWLAGDRDKMRSVLSEVNSSGKSDESIANAFNARVKEAYENNEIGLEQYADYLDKTSMFDTEKSATKIKNLVKEEFVNGERSEDDTIRVLTEICGMNGDKAWKTVQQWEAKAEHADEEEYSYSQYEDLREALDAGKSLQEAGAEYLEHGYSEKQIADAAVDHLRDRFAAGEISEDEAIRLYSAYKGKDENDAWKKVQEWAAKAEHADDEDYSYSQYDAIDEAIAANKDIKALVKELTDHGVKEENITSHVKGYLVDRYVTGGVTETALKNQLSRYLGIVAKDDVDKILNDANSKKQYGVNYSSLDEEYRAGNIKASEMKSALMKYGGLSAADADKKIRWYDLQKANPSLEISESKANTWYDGTSYTKTNGHESAKTAGMSIQDYLRAKDELAKVQGVDANNDGRTDTGSREIAYIRALTGMSWLTDRQRRALYYEEYKGTSKTSKRPW